MMTPEFLFALLFAYLFGAVPFGLLIGWSRHVDVRTLGSCNIGATNVSRCVGPWWGKLCFFCDFFKGLLPVLAVQYLAPEAGAWYALAVAAAAVLGHVYPVYLKFKGGKGVSTAAGAAAALAPLVLLAAFAVWVAVFLVGRYVSLASITAALALAVFALLFRFLGWGSTVATGWETIGFFAVMAALAIWKHRENIRRLLNGTENRFSRAAKSQPQQEK